MEIIIMGFIAIFMSVGASTLINKKKEPQGDLLTREQGKQLATRIKGAEQELKKQSDTFKKLDNKILAQTQEFNNVDNKRIHKQKQIHDTLKLINIQLQEKGKGKITEEQALEQLNNLDDDFNELEDVEKELDKLKSNNKYSLSI